MTDILNRAFLTELRDAAGQKCHHGTTDAQDSALLRICLGACELLDSLPVEQPEYRECKTCRGRQEHEIHCPSKGQPI
jgi:hypothetical protein